MWQNEVPALLKALDCTTKGMYSTKTKWKPEHYNCSDKCPNYGKLRNKIIKRDSLEDCIIVVHSECEANKRTSTLLTGKWVQDCSGTFVVDDGWQEFQSETLFVNTHLLPFSIF